jgi:predicted RNase H-like nuclease (RuvC/YqgF family)
MFHLLLLSVLLQRPTPPPTRNVVTKTTQQEMDRILNRTPIKAVEDKSVRAARLKQINEDFRELQVANNKLMAEVATQKFDVKFVEKMLSQIATRAKRLQANLSLPKVEAKEGASTIESLEKELTQLDQVIVRFANNPLFKAANVVDLELANKASADLDEIVRTTTRLRKNPQR